MSNKTAYVWGPISNFSGCLLYLLLENGWHLHIAGKSALQISLSPLDLVSTARHNIERAAGSADKLKHFHEHLLFLDSEEPQRGVTYDIVLFMGLPSNFDEPRVSRAPWAADELAKITGKLKGVPVIVISSLWGGIQNDGAVPEEIEFERRKPLSQFESVCQQYETRILKAISKQDCRWHLVRLPLILGSSLDGRSVSFTGLYKLLKELYQAKNRHGDDRDKSTIELSYNPDATFWMLPCDWAANLLLKLIEDTSRPVICNVVSTQATLNQEWLQELARALALKSVHASGKDNLSLPSTLRSMLADNIQVKTANLFEVLGRYQQAPMMLTRDYFANVLHYASQQNWGQSSSSKPESPFSPEKARTFFEKFLPAHLDRRMLKELEQFKGGLAFQIADQDDKQGPPSNHNDRNRPAESSLMSGDDDCRWLLSIQDGRAVTTPLDNETHKPQVSFLISAMSFSRLTSGTMLLEAALITRTLQVNGNPIQCLKACEFFRRFLGLHHFEPGLESIEKIPEEAGSS